MFPDAQQPLQRLVSGSETLAEDPNGDTRTPSDEEGAAHEPGVAPSADLVGAAGRSISAADIQAREAGGVFARGDCASAHCLYHPRSLRFPHPRGRRRLRNAAPRADAGATARPKPGGEVSAGARGRCQTDAGTDRRPRASPRARPAASARPRFPADARRVTSCTCRSGRLLRFCTRTRRLSLASRASCGRSWWSRTGSSSRACRRDGGHGRRRGEPPAEFLGIGSLFAPP